MTSERHLENIEVNDDYPRFFFFFDILKITVGIYTTRGSKSE